jgi:hypothetical protein
MNELQNFTREDDPKLKADNAITFNPMSAFATGSSLHKFLQSSATNDLIDCFIQFRSWFVPGAPRRHIPTFALEITPIYLTRFTYLIIPKLDGL